MEFMTSTAGDDINQEKTVTSAALGSRIEDYTQLELTILRLFMFLLTVLGISLNSMVIYLYASTRKIFSQPMNLLFISLALADCMVSVCATSVSFIHTLLLVRMPDIFCAWYGFMSTLAGLANIHALSVIAVERFIVMREPCKMGATNWFRASVLIAYTWLLALLVALLPLTGFGAYVHEGPGFWCSVQWEQKSLLADIYMFFMFSTSYFWPTLVIVFALTGIVLKIREVSQVVGLKELVRAERILTRQTAVMVSGYMVAWTPYAVICMIAAVQKANPFSPKVALAPTLIAKTSTIYNSFIYVALNKQFQQAFVDKILRGKNPWKARTTSSDGSRHVTLKMTTKHVSKSSLKKSNQVLPVPNLPLPTNA